MQKQPEVGMFTTVGSLSSTGLHLKMKSVEKMVSDFLLVEPPDLTLHYNAPDDYTFRFSSPDLYLKFCI